MKSSNTNLGAPIWMNDEEEDVDLSRNVPGQSTVSSSSHDGVSEQGCTYRRMIYVAFRIIAISLSVLMAATAALGLSK